MSGPPVPLSSAVFRSTAFARAGNIGGPPADWRKRRRLAPTWGEAMLVPPIETQSLPLPPPSQLCAVEMMSDPGATMSGLIRPAPVGPPELNPALVSSQRATVFRSAIAPTVIRFYGAR